MTLALHWMWEAIGFLCLLALGAATLGAAVLVARTFGRALGRRLRLPLLLLRAATWRRRRRMSRIPAAYPQGRPAQPLTPAELAAWQETVREVSR